jgi:CRP-like cAMP-binding protein
MGSGSVSGIVTRQYKAGSIVYFEGDKSEYIYVLKVGKVLLTYIRPESGEEIKEDIRPGEFFGVKSSLGRYPREETAQTLSDAVVLQLRLDDFERIVLTNVQLVKKMLRVFSNQLRRIGRAVREVLGETSVLNPEAELFKIGEYYYRNGRAEQAIYAYKKYLEYYPNTQFSAVSMQRVKDIQSGNFTAMPVDVAPVAASAPADEEGSFDSSPDFSMDSPADGPSDMVDFDFDDGGSSPSPMTSVAPGMHTELTSEMDSFLGSGDDGFGITPAAPQSATALLEQGKSLQEAGQHQQALDKFSLIVSDGAPSDILEREAWEEAHVMTGFCFYNLGKLKEALNDLSMFMKNYPQSKFIKNAMLYMGFVFEKAGSKDKAIPYYKKVMTMPPRDDFTTWAMNKLKGLGV